MKTIEELFIEYTIENKGNVIDLKDTFISLCRNIDAQFKVMSDKIQELENKEE